MKADLLLHDHFVPFNHYTKNVETDETVSTQLLDVSENMFIITLSVYRKTAQKENCTN